MNVHHEPCPAGMSADLTLPARRLPPQWLIAPADCERMTPPPLPPPAPNRIVPVSTPLPPPLDLGLRRRRKPRGLAPRRESDTAVFLTRWLKAPHRIGALAPSSRHLARAMAIQVDLRRAGVVVELGGGTGSVTRALLDAGIPADRLVVVERDALLYRMLRRRFPQLRIVEGDARQLVELLRPLGIDAVSSVVSSLPLVAMSRRMRRQIIEQSFALLGEAGRFVQYTYSLTSPLGLRELGLRGRVAARVWLNFPPAAVWSYRRAAQPA
jgi:phosphatidylethanolamine/phosphatidyl-N-methylethanolamine N-methyltransferase